MKVPNHNQLPNREKVILIPESDDEDNKKPKDECSGCERCQRDCDHSDNAVR